MENVRWDLLRHTRELGFRAPIHDRTENRCVHYDELRDEFDPVEFDDSHTDDVNKNPWKGLSTSNHRLIGWNSPACGTPFLI